MSSAPEEEIFRVILCSFYTQTVFLVLWAGLRVAGDHPGFLIALILLHPEKGVNKRVAGEPFLPTPASLCCFCIRMALFGDLQAFSHPVISTSQWPWGWARCRWHCYVAALLGQHILVASRAGWWSLSLQETCTLQHDMQRPGEGGFCQEVCLGPLFHKSTSERA